GIRDKLVTGVQTCALPIFAFVVVFFVIPLGMTAWMSLHNWPLMGEHAFIGLDNYFAILRDTRFWNALKFTFYYTVIVTIAIFARSEERRVGKECRWRWWTV